MVQRVVIERSCGQNLESGLKNAAGECGIACLFLTDLRDQLGGIVGWELVNEKEIGGGDGIFQQLDAFADERRDGQQLFG